MYKKYLNGCGYTRNLWSFGISVHTQIVDLLNECELVLEICLVCVYDELKFLRYCLRRIQDRGASHSQMGVFD